MKKIDVEESKTTKGVTVLDGFLGQRAKRFESRAKCEEPQANGGTILAPDARHSTLRNGFSVR